MQLVFRQILRVLPQLEPQHLQADGGADAGAGGADVCMHCRECNWSCSLSLSISLSDLSLSISLPLSLPLSLLGDHRAGQ